jgi:hypothetical protein
MFCRFCCFWWVQFGGFVVLMFYRFCCFWWVQFGGFVVFAVLPFLLFLMGAVWRFCCF